MPRWHGIIVRSVIGGVAAGAWAAIVNLMGCPSVLISLAAILVVFGVSGDFG